MNWNLRTQSYPNLLKSKVPLSLVKTCSQICPWDCCSLSLTVIWLTSHLQCGAQLAPIWRAGRTSEYIFHPLILDWLTRLGSRTSLAPIATEPKWKLMHEARTSEFFLKLCLCAATARILRCHKDWKLETSLFRKTKLGHVDVPLKWLKAVEKKQNWDE